MLLNLVKDGKVILSVSEGSWVQLPNGKVFSPAQLGWSQGGYSLVEAPVESIPQPVLIETQITPDEEV